MACCLVGLSLKADETYLSGSQKALIALSLKGMLLNDRDTSQTRAQLLQTNLHHNQKPDQVESIEVKVNSFVDFLNLQKNDELFTQRKLKQLSLEELYLKLAPTHFSSAIPSVQRKIERYFQQKSISEKRFLQSTVGFLHDYQMLWDSKISLTERIFRKLNESIDTYIQSLLKKNPSDDVVLLTQLLKSYFKNLPSEQRAEIFYRLMQLSMESSTADIFLTMLQHSGPQMQKLVQIMGRSASIPKEFQTVFQRLESQVQAVPWWEVKNAIEAEISLSEFSYFEKKPIGVGTIAQTHRAQMIDANGVKRSYAIGFRKPDIENLLEMDHQVLLKVCAEVDADPIIQKMRIPSLRDRVEDIHASVVEELVMADKVKNQKLAVGVYETQKIIQFSKQKNELRIHVPEVQLIGKNQSLMKQELIFGKKPASEIKSYQELYPELYRVAAEKVAELWVEQAFFKSGFFHADLHQGNLLMQVLENHVQINLLDFGMVGQLNLSQRQNVLLLTLGLDLNKPQVVTDAFVGLSRQKISEQQKIELTKLVTQRMRQRRSDLQADTTIQSWTTWALENGIELQYEFIKLNRGLMAINSLLEASGSPLNIENLGNQMALRNKKFVLSVVGQAENIKYMDLLQVGFKLRTNKNQAGSKKCEGLFNN